LFTASLAGNYQIAAVTALILLVPSIAFMLLIERFLTPIPRRHWLAQAPESPPWRRPVARHPLKRR
jgi:hypothetical protein